MTCRFMSFSQPFKLISVVRSSRFRKVLLHFIRANMGKPCSLVQFTFIILVGIANFPLLTDSKGQYVMPVLGGMKMSLPYDIANVFIRPIAGHITVFLSVAILCILFFGVITSPFGYMFGIPSRKYVLGGTDADVHPASSRSFDLYHWNDTVSILSRIDQYRQTFPTFEDQAFYLLPPTINNIEECKLLTLCHAHNVITRLPLSVLKTVKFFSEKLIALSPSHMDAIKRGIHFQEDCSEVYSGCEESGYTIAAKTLLYWMPPFLKNHTHRRKRSMYM